MSTVSPIVPAPAARGAVPLVVAGIAGLGWNGYGILQFAATAGADAASLVGAGMTAEQAALLAGLPAWMTAAFALGVFGGALGSLLLAFRRAAAVPVLAVSLAAYGVLYAGDAALGVFAAFGAPQVAILTLVVAIAAALLVLARRAARRSHLG